MSNVPTPQNINNLIPPPPTGRKNVIFQADDNNPRNVSAYTDGATLGGITVINNTSYTLTQADTGTLIVFTNNSPVTVSLDSSLPANFFATVLFLGTAGGTLVPTTGLINGDASIPVSSGTGGWLFFDGTNWYFIQGATTSPVTAPIPVEGEVVTFTGTTGTLAFTPSTVTNYTTVKLYRGGIRLLEGVGNDFTRSGAVITLASAAGTENFVADYYR